MLDAESALLAGMRDFCERHRVAWALVLEADAAERTSREWASLSKVAQAGMTAVRASVEAAGPAVLLVNAGMLARYDGSLTLFDELRESVRTATAGTAVRTVWVLVPWADAEKQPLLDGGAPVPPFGSQWLALSEEWIARHESRLAEGGNGMIEAKRLLADLRVRNARLLLPASTRGVGRRLRGARSRRRRPGGCRCQRGK